MQVGTSNNRRVGEIAYAAAVLRENVKVQNQILNYLDLVCPNGSPVIDAWRPKLDEAASRVREIVHDLIESVTIMPDGKLIINYNFPLIEEVRSSQLTIASCYGQRATNKEFSLQYLGARRSSRRQGFGTLLSCQAIVRDGRNNSSMSLKRYCQH